MDSEKRKFILLALIVISAVVIGLIIYFLVFYTFSRNAKNEGPVPQPPPQANLVTNVKNGAGTAATGTPTPATSVDLVQEDVSQVAKMFVERYGTYSNQGGSDQFSDLNLFVTKRMKDWLVANTKEILAGLQSYETSFVVTTNAVTAQILSLDKTAGRATVLVGTKRSEQAGEETPKVTNKNIKVELLKAGGRWKVDSAVWQ